MWQAETKDHSSHSLSGESTWKKNPPTAMNVNRDHERRAGIECPLIHLWCCQGCFFGRDISKAPLAHVMREAHKACVVGVSSRSRVHSTLDGFSHLKTHRQRWMFTVTRLTLTFPPLEMVQNYTSIMQQPRLYYLKYVTRMHLLLLSQNIRHGSKHDAKHSVLSCAV